MSEFWLRKMRTYFTRIDFDGDGKITRADFKGMVDRFTESGRLSEARIKALETSLTAVWDKYLSVVGGGKAMDETTFIDAMKRLKANDPQLKVTLEEPLPYFFEAVDEDQDGNISGKEYEIFFEILGLKPDLAKESFKAIDTNNDGLLSLDEFKTAGSQFFLSEDENSPSKNFWGPLN